MKRFASSLLLDDVVIGGGNAKKLKQVPRAAGSAATPTRSLAGSDVGESRKQGTFPACNSSENEETTRSQTRGGEAR
jgi:hypothetical protein